MTAAARLRITLLDLDPAPWRLVEVPLSMSFKGLHDVIQAAFGWFDIHLWEFNFDGRTYGLPHEIDLGLDGDRIYNASYAHLTKFHTAEVGAFLYTYDMGDDWTHRIDVVALFEAEPGTLLPHFIEGQWRAPPEDVGGSFGFEHFLEALSDPDHEDHDDLMDWHGGPFDPTDIEEDTVHAQLKRLAKKRRSKN